MLPCRRRGEKNDAPTVEDFWSQKDSINLLAELVLIDLERRLKSGQDIRVESYLARFPVLAHSDVAVLDAIVAEFRWRRRLKRPESVDSFCQRFPQWAATLSDRLGSIGLQSKGGTQERAELNVATIEYSGTIHSPRGIQQPTRVSAPSGYEILGVLGRGGMGVVYKARQVSLNRVVALKMILDRTPLSSEQTARFRTEAHVLAKLQHPNIVQVFETGLCDGVPYLSLEFVPGGSLDKVLKKTPQTPAVAARFAQQLARAIQAAHDQGIIHRDLKPANILMFEEREGNDPSTTLSLAAGTPKISDFGLAKQLEIDQGQTATGAVLGTPAYMAPEQAAGRLQDLGPATDIYALGVILYEMLTGTLPFRGPTVIDTLDAIRTQEPVPPQRLQPKVPRDLALICLKCLSKEPRRRFASAGELAEELERFNTGQPLRVTRPVGSWERGWRWCRRNPAKALATAFVSIFLVSVFASAVWIAWRESEHASDLKNEQEETAKAMKAAKKNEGLAVGYRKDAERLTVDLSYGKGLEHCKKGEVAAGLLWMGEALDTAERTMPAGDSQRFIRQNIHAWSKQIRHLQWMGHHRAGFVADNLSEDPKRARIGTNPRPWYLGRRALVFNPALTLLATCDDKVATLRDVDTGEVRGLPLHHDGTILAAAFHPDGLVAATAARDNSVKLWEVPSGKPIGVPIPLPDSPHTVAFSQDGARLLLAHPKAAEIHDLTGKKPTLRFQDSLIHTAVLSPDGRWLATGINAEYASLWDAFSGKKIADLVSRKLNAEPRSMDGVWFALFSRDSKRLVTFSSVNQGGLAQITKVWSVPDGKELANFIVTPVWGMDLTADATTVLTASLGMRPRLWDVADGSAKFRELDSHEEIRDNWWAEYSRDGRRIVTADSGGKVQFWHADTALPAGPPLLHPSGAYYAGFGPNDRHLATWTNDGTVRVWEGKLKPPFRSLCSEDSKVKMMAVDPAGDRMLVFCEDQQLQIRSARDGKVLAKLGSQEGLGAGRFGSDGKLVWSGDGKGMVRTFTADTGEILGAPVPFRYAQSGFTPSPDGKYLYGDHAILDLQNRQQHHYEGHRYVTFGFPSLGPRMGVSTNSNIAEILDPLSGRVLDGTFQSGMMINSVAMTLDGSSLFAGGMDGQIRNWKLPEGKIARTFAHRENVFGLLASPDGTRLLANSSKLAQLYDVAKGTDLGDPLPRAIAWAFSPDNLRLAVIDEKNQLHLRDAKSGRPLGDVLPLPGKCNRLEFSLAHRWLTLFDSQGQGWQLDLDPSDLPADTKAIQAWVRTITGYTLDENHQARALTEPEWRGARTKYLNQPGGSR